jgi:hypothetical protein
MPADCLPNNGCRFGSGARVAGDVDSFFWLGGSAREQPVESRGPQIVPGVGTARGRGGRRVHCRLRHDLSRIALGVGSGADDVAIIVDGHLIDAGAACERASRHGYREILSGSPTTASAGAPLRSRSAFWGSPKRGDPHHTQRRQPMSDLRTARARPDLRERFARQFFRAANPLVRRLMAAGFQPVVGIFS